MVVKVDPGTEALAQGRSGVKRMQVKVLVLDGPPEPLDKDVVLAAAPAIHADGDLVVLQDIDKVVAGKLSTLVGVEDFRPSVATQGLLEGINTEVGLKGIGNPPGQDFAAVPVHDGHKVHEPMGHGDVGDIRGPDLIGSIDGQVAKQVGENPVFGVGPAGVRLGVYGLDAHQTHQPLDMLSIDNGALASELTHHRAAAPARML